MRAIKFRGKTFENPEWAYGDLLNFGNNVLSIGSYAPIGYELKRRVDPDTVGQFTGLTDKNGKAIYEGDILRTPPKTDYDKKNFVAYEVFWHDNDCASHHIGWQMNRCHFQGCICGTTYIPEFLPKTTATMEVVGNIHDNPELLGEKGDEQ